MRWWGDEMSWPAYLVALLILILGLMAVESVAPSIASLLVLAIVLGVAVVHPTFARELVKLAQSLKLRGGSTP